MTIHEIRESLEQGNIQLDSAGFGIIQKKINLNPQASRHTMVQCDLFQDTIATSNMGMPFHIEFFVSPLPIVYTNMQFSGNIPATFNNRGPSAAVDIVLFKSILSTRNDAAGNPLQVLLEETAFPNQTLGTLPTFSWYSPELYLTAIIHGFDDDIVQNLGLSFYIAVDAKKVSALQAGLGIVREGSIAQGMTLVSQGREIKRAANVGQVFPMWKHGGTTPERMIRADALSDFFLQYHNAAASEKTMTTTNIRSYVRRANQMQASGTAFGSLDPTKGQVPDWIKLDLVQGLVTGPLRSQWPPNKYHDNGNVMVL
tara:strand:+ start:1747 stop:2685 length:939 start_codon:yes stop_codon:yes gene_type:complete